MDGCGASEVLRVCSLLILPRQILGNLPFFGAV